MGEVFLHVKGDIHVSENSHHFYQLATREGEMAPRRCLSVELCVVKGGEVEGEESGEGPQSLYEGPAFSGRELPTPGQELESRD